MKFNVLITADTTVSTMVDVEAKDSAEAEHKALMEAIANPEAFNWTRDDGTASDPYIADPGNSAEIVTI